MKPINLPEEIRIFRVLAPSGSETFPRERYVAKLAGDDPSFGLGKGWTEEQRINSAVGEAIERRVLRTLSTGKRPRASSHDPGTSSNGAACGTDAEDAITRGFAELLERDAFYRYLNFGTYPVSTTTPADWGLELQKVAESLYGWIGMRLHAVEVLGHFSQRVWVAWGTIWNDLWTRSPLQRPGIIAGACCPTAPNYGAPQETGIKGAVAEIVQFVEFSSDTNAGATENHSVVNFRLLRGKYSGDISAVANRAPLESTHTHTQTKTADVSEILSAYRADIRVPVATNVATMMGTFGFAQVRCAQLLSPLHVRQALARQRDPAELAAQHGLSPHSWNPVESPL